MTTTPTIAQRLAAHPRFRRGAAAHDLRGTRERWWRPGDVPDLTDPATAGVLLSWLDEAIVLLSRDCVPTVQAGGSTHHGDTLGEAAGKALLAQWGKL